MPIRVAIVRINDINSEINKIPPIISCGSGDNTTFLILLSIAVRIISTSFSVDIDAENDNNNDLSCFAADICLLDYHDALNHSIIVVDYPDIVRMTQYLKIVSK